MKKTAKKTPRKASGRKAIRNLEVKPAKGGTVRGGTAPRHEKWIE